MFLADKLRHKSEVGESYLLRSQRFEDALKEIFWQHETYGDKTNPSVMAGIAYKVLVTEGLTPGVKKK